MSEALALKKFIGTLGEFYCSRKRIYKHRWSVTILSVQLSAYFWKCGNSTKEAPNVNRAMYTVLVPS